MILVLELCNMNNLAFTMFTKVSILKIMSFYLFECRIKLKRSQSYSKCKGKDAARIIEVTTFEDQCVEYPASRRKGKFRCLGDNCHVNMQVDN